MHQADIPEDQDQDQATSQKEMITGENDLRLEGIFDSDQLRNYQESRKKSLLYARSVEKLEYFLHCQAEALTPDELVYRPMIPYDELTFTASETQAWKERITQIEQQMLALCIEVVIKDLGRIEKEKIDAEQTLVESIASHDRDGAVSQVKQKITDFRNLARIKYEVLLEGARHRQAEFVDASTMVQLREISRGGARNHERYRSVALSYT